MTSGSGQRLLPEPQNRHFCLIATVKFPPPPNAAKYIVNNGRALQGVALPTSHL